MTLPLIATKLYLPRPRSNVVHRRRLTELLDDGASRKLTLISAPAGYGKTTLVAAWLAGCGRPAAWLTVDEGDNDWIRFLSYAIAALRTLDESLGGQALTLLQSPQPPHPEAILSTLINELASVPEPFALVLDDVHEIRSNAVHESISFLLEHMPPRMHLVLLTREEPELPLARLRMRGEVADLGVDELRFRPEETAEFLADSMGLELTAEAASALERRTEGWIAGLQIAAVRCRDGKLRFPRPARSTAARRCYWIISWRKCCGNNRRQFATFCSLPRF
jgi:LuxR family maltose regulon positive regulatory protein